MYYYAYMSRVIRDYDQAVRLAAATPRSWLHWNYDAPGHEGRVWALAEAGPISGPDAVQPPPQLRLDDGRGYGVPVYDEKRRVVGHAYATYPRSPGVATYCGKLMWPRAPHMDEPFVAPVPPSPLHDSASSLEFRAMVARTGDPYPGDGAPREWDALKTRFMLI